MKSPNGARAEHYLSLRKLNICIVFCGDKKLVGLKVVTVVSELVSVLENIPLEVFSRPMFFLPFRSVSIQTTYVLFGGLSLLGSARRFTFNSTA